MDMGGAIQNEHKDRTRVGFRIHNDGRLFLGAQEAKKRERMYSSSMNLAVSRGREF